jgi:uncharacterized membrane protein YeaQ/YmgE (transglycosylase-associated protein family)
MEILWYVFSGLLGGVASALLWSKDWCDLKKYDTFKDVVLGAIGGYVYFLMHSEWSLPDGVVAFVFGYAFQDFINGVVEKVKAIVGASKSRSEAQ